MSVASANIAHRLAPACTSAVAEILLLTMEPVAYVNKIAGDTSITIEAAGKLITIVISVEEIGP